MLLGGCYCSGVNSFNHFNLLKKKKKTNRKLSGFPPSPPALKFCSHYWSPQLCSPILPHLTMPGSKSYKTALALTETDPKILLEAAAQSCHNCPLYLNSHLDVAVLKSCIHSMMTGEINLHKLPCICNYQHGKLFCPHWPINF